MASDPGSSGDALPAGVEVRAVEHSEGDPGRRALEVLDKVLRERPDSGTSGRGREQLGLDFSETTRLLCGHRDILIQAQRAAGPTPASQARLQEVNGVLSTVLGGHFPLGDIPWAQLEKARDVLARLVVQG